MAKLEADKVEKIRRVIEAILTAPDEDLSACQGFRPEIISYVEKELAGEDPSQANPTLAAHLSECPDCFEEHADLSKILRAEQEGKLEEPPRPGEFDFSFLQK